MSLSTRKRLQTGLWAIVSLGAAGLGARMTFHAITTGAYSSHGRIVDDPFSVWLHIALMSLGVLLTAGLGIAFVYAFWASREEEARIDAYLRKRRSKV